MTSTLTTPRSAFRAHHTRPGQVSSQLFGALIDEWIGLNQSRSTLTELHRWANLEPLLAGYTQPADIVDAIDAAENTVKDAMLLALLRLAQAGHQLAGRILLQQMLPSIGKLTKTSPSQPTSDNRWAEDRRHIAVAEFWDLVSTLNLERHEHGIATTLHMRMVSRIFGRRSPHQTLPVGDADDVWTAATPHQPAQTEDTGPTLAEVLQWGVRTQIITTTDAELLTHIYIGDHTAVEAAARFDLTHAQARQRCSRATRRLAAAVAAARDQVA
ncbi:MAG: hypothetical protein LCH96_16850 [Actinobacteria bacterium]|nr:hypothetical protein [Actinomycetota bacterium]